MTPAPRRPLTRASNRLRRSMQSSGFSGIVTIDDDDDEILASFMTSLEEDVSGYVAENNQTVDGHGDGLDGELGDIGGDDGFLAGDRIEGEGEVDGGNTDYVMGDDPDFKEVYESENEDILLYEHDSDDEVRMKKGGNPKYNPKISIEQYVFELGMEFNSIKEFKEAIRSYAIDGGYQIHLTRNEKERCQAKCDIGYPWMIWCSKISGEKTFQIKTYERRHMCSRRMDNKQANSSWLALRLVDKVRGEPKVSAGNLVTFAKDNMSLDISRTHAYRAKKKALEIIDGKHQEQYGKLRSYMAEVLRTNVGSTCNILVDRNRHEDPAVFKRIYMCLAPLRDGFLAGCRPLIGLDGCFLKTSYGGQLLTTVSQDSCNG
ncbi:uncharacterized protein LOC119982974 [Tripterygium wilfordii]|uniref:uncharacterized protein LOC119982974 n=1 Tax=Tripterygium wilfordii TaxID=458696 RepID=UPI0018F8496B|nr:uncharacterized protein LOC119982974 [Tripterygium wilfordii]XP_038682525.1 uncharacterized protein LOC119982974 [Tripterygium wilfordii]XP_038682526.1 uncharacterized protein LOC119982974 [Tripterygium wilfordii]XP_038682527.1 uncharacterized protein LOC119982974 [Tripterygium wilfordii]